MAWAYSTTTASGTASISGTTLTFSATPTGTVAVGQVVTGTGITANTNIISGSGLVWTVNNSQTVASTAVTCTTKILTATGGTQASPNSFAAGVLAVQTADSLAGLQSNRYNLLTNVRIDVAQSAWVKWDDLNYFEFRGSTRYNPAAESTNLANNGANTIVGLEVQCMVNTNVFFNDNGALLVNSGGTLITLRSASGVNPLFIQQTGTRNDFPTFTPVTPAVINIAGLTIRNNGASRKSYFGLARSVVAANNLNYENVYGEYQTSFTSYNGYSAPVASHAGDGASILTNAIFYNSSWGTEQTGTIDFVISASGRYTNYINYNPIFPTTTWSGIYTAAASSWSIDNRYAATMYSHTPTFKSGSTKLADIVVQWLGARTLGTTNYNLANISEALSKNATTTSTGVVSNYLLSAMIGREAGANSGTSNKYQWSCKARAYSYISADQYVWSARSFLSDGTNGQVVEDVQLLSVPYLNLTQAQAAALTGISLVASGANGGVLTLTSNHTIAEVWAYYRNWISTLANFSSNDTWEFDNTTLNLGAWTIVGLQYLTTGKVIASTSSSGGAFTASTTGNVTQATPTNLTGVTITGNLTYNTNTPITITLTDCSISGTISNSGTGLVTISLGNSTIGTIGANIATRPVTSLNLTGLIAGSQIYIADGAGDQISYVSNSGTSYTLATTGQTGVWSVKVARYGYISQTGSHLPAIASTTLLITLAADPYITEATKDNVANYTTLENLDKLYDYSAYYETLNNGIPYSRIITKAGTAASAGIYDVILNNSGSIWSFDGSALSIYSTDTLASGTTISGALFTSGNVTLTTAQSNTKITANVLQDVPTDLSGMVITGNLTYNYDSDISVNFTDCIVTGTIENSNTGIIKVFRVGTSLWFTEGTNVLVRANVEVTTVDGLALTTAILKNGYEDIGWVSQDVARILEIAQGETFSIYAIAYGYQADLFSATSDDFTSFRIALNPEIYIDTTLDITTRNIIVSSFSSYRDDNNRLPFTINTDLRNYSTAQVLNALHYYIVSQAYWVGTAVVFGAPINGFTFIQGGIYIADSNYYWKVSDDITTPTNLGYLLPIVIGVDSSVYTAYPSYSPVEMNTSDIVMQYAPWTHITAEISTLDKNDIRDKIWTADNRILNNQYFD